MYDVVIIGAGVIGGMIARELSRYGAKVCILEKENDVSKGASSANSGIVHAGFDAETGSLKAILNVKGAKMMKQVTDELGVKYKNNGSIVAGFNEDDERTINELYARGVANGVEQLQVLTGEKIRKIEPGLSKDVSVALYAPTAGIVCPYELTIASIGNAMDNGCELRYGFNVDKIEYADGIYKIYKGNEFVETKFVVNAAGLYSDSIANMIGDNSFDVHPRRGEYMLLDKGNASVSHTVFKTPSKMGKGILVSPTVDGNLLLGPTSVDMTDKEDKSVYAEGLAAIRKSASDCVDNIKYNKIITSFCGLRAVGDTHDFIINSPKDGFVNVAGIESPGLSASPAIAEYVRIMLQDMGFNFELKSNFNPYRKPDHYFKNLTMEEKNKIISADNRYGKIICRCETVTEGEIVEAIHKNPPANDLDAIKRRTRSGMGRCQGGFCSTSIVEILSRELDVPVESVTKFGGNSYIVCGKTK